MGKNESAPKPFLLTESEASRLPGFQKSLALLHYWSGLAETQHLHRIDIDPLELGAAMLPNLVLIDVIDDGEDFRWRLFGGAHELEYGFSLKGTTIRTLMGQNPNVSEIFEIFRKCKQDECPTFYEAQYTNDKGLLRAARGILLPLFDHKNQHVTCLIGCSEWVDIK